MLGLEFTVTGLDRTDLTLRQAERTLERNLRTFVKDASLMMHAKMQEVAPEFDRDYKESMIPISGQAGDEYFGILFSIDDEGKVLALEYGRTSKTPPPARALLPWVQAKWGGDMGDAIRLARVIAAGSSGGTANTGTQPFQRTFEAVEGPIFERALEVIKVF